MGHLIADQDLRDRLHGIVEPVEIRDAAGQLLGTFVPHVSNEVRALYEEAVASFDLDEAGRRLAAHQPGQGRTTEQVLARLRALEQGE
ncbi:MAG: hypothetical protein U0736_24270 [Gemmataceae bacterium]